MIEQWRTVAEGVCYTARSERRVCRWLGFHCYAARYVPEHRDTAALGVRLRELTEEHPRWGAPVLFSKLHQEGMTDNNKRVRRL
jgi:hypothetical protein